MKRLFEIIVLAILILIAMLFKEDIEQMEGPADRYVHPSPIYDHRGDELLTDTIYVYE